MNDGDKNKTSKIGKRKKGDGSTNKVAGLIKHNHNKREKFPGKANSKIG